MKKYRFIHRAATLFLCLFILSSALLLTLHSTWYYKIAKNYCDSRYQTNTDATAITAANYDAFMLELINPRSTAICLPSYELTALDIQAAQQLRLALFVLYSTCLISFLLIIWSLHHLQNLSHFRFLLSGALTAFPIAAILLFIGGSHFSGSVKDFIQLLNHGENILITNSTLWNKLIYPGYLTSHIILFYFYLIIFFLLCLILYKIFSREKKYF